MNIPVKPNYLPRWVLLGQGFIALFALLGIIAIQWLQKPQGSLGQTSDGVIMYTSAHPKQEEQQEAVNLKILKASPTFGFDNLIADWVFLKFLQYFGDEPARNVTGYQLNADYFDLITDLDPRWVDIYLFLSTSISYYIGQPEQSIKLMDRGTKALSPQIHPQSWVVWRFKGLDQFLLLGDIPASIHSHEMAALWTKGTPYQKFAPILQSTADFLRQDPDSKLIFFNSWLSVYGQTKDKRVRDRATKEILKLGGEMQKDKTGEINFILPKGKF